VAGDPDQSIYGFQRWPPGFFFKSLPAEDRGARDEWHPAESPGGCAMRIMTGGRNGFFRPTGERGPLTSRPGGTCGKVYTHKPRKALRARIEDALKGLCRPVSGLSSSSRFPEARIEDRANPGRLWYPVAPGSGRISARGDRFRNRSHKDTLERETVNVWQLTRAVRRYAAGGDIAPMPYEEAEALILATLPPAGRQSGPYRDLEKRKLRRTPPIRVGDVARWIPLAPRRPADPGPPENLRPALVEARIQACISREEPARDGDRPRSRPSGYHPREAKGLEAPAVLLHYRNTSPAWLPRLARTRNAWPKERRVYFVGATRAISCPDPLSTTSPLRGPGFGRPT